MRSTKKVEMIGKKFGFLTVLSEDAKRNKHGQIMYNCVCDCGNTKFTLGQSLRNGKTSSCNKCSNRKNVKHGMWTTREFNIWNSMIERCSNPNGGQKEHYFDRGISVCDSWKESFINFYNYMGDSHGLTLDRIDVNGNYEPSNCRWATPKQQSRNKTNNRVITHNGESLCISEWCEKIGMPTSTFHNRLIRGWSEQDTIEQPVNSKHRKFIKN